MMRMTFFWTPDLGEFFFNGLKINTAGQLAILCGVLALFSVLYEAIKVYSAYARARTAREQIASVSCAPSESANLLATENNSRNTFSHRFCRLINETIVFFCHNTIGYALMLSVMVYSGWLFLAVVFSMGLGYFFFGHISMKVNMESIQVRTTKITCSPACAEAGTSANANRAACPAVPNQQCHGQVTTTSSCHENKVVCEVESNGRQEDSEASPTTETVSDESCSCRL